jgi:Tol biopolymer transport system component
VTLRPSPTPRPTETPWPTVTFTPTATPHPVVGLLYDQWTQVSIPQRLRSPLDRPHFALVSLNERTAGTSNPNTPMPAMEVETLFLVNPASSELIEVLDLPVTTEDRIYWSPDGSNLVYFMEPTLLADNTRAGGLYLLNLTLGISLRLVNIPSLAPRGIADHEPVWSPDGTRLALALPTAYDVDIFVISADGSSFENVTRHGAYDLWPAWSPDGRLLAFVSDRLQCPSWVPDEAGSCSALDAAPPVGGNLFVLDMQTGSVQQVSDMYVDGPPVWVSNLQVAFTTGLSDPFSAESELWITNVMAGTSRRVSPPASGILNLGAAWAPGGQQVIYHEVADPPSVVLRDASGGLIGSTDRFLFSRFGFAATWSPEGEWVAFGGRDGRCPYGLTVARNTLEIVYAASTPGACDPRYSPDGQWLAYAGFQTRAGAADGRLDLYVANPNGYNSRNLTSRLRGEIRLLGWVGGTASN